MKIKFEKDDIKEVLTKHIKGLMPEAKVTEVVKESYGDYELTVELKSEEKKEEKKEGEET